MKHFWIQFISHRKFSCIWQCLLEQSRNFFHKCCVFEWVLSFKWWPASSVEHWTVLQHRHRATYSIYPRHKRRFSCSIFLLAESSPCQRVSYTPIVIITFINGTWLGVLDKDYEIWTARLQVHLMFIETELCISVSSEIIIFYSPTRMNAMNILISYSNISCIIVGIGSEEISTKLENVSLETGLHRIIWGHLIWSYHVQSRSYRNGIWRRIPQK